MVDQRNPNTLQIIFARNDPDLTIDSDGSIKEIHSFSEEGWSMSIREEFDDKSWFGDREESGMNVDIDIRRFISRHIFGEVGEALHEVLPHFIDGDEDGIAGDCISKGFHCDCGYSLNHR